MSISRQSFKVLTAALSVGLLNVSTSSGAAEKCGTTLECAQQAVEAAAQSNASFQTMQKKITDLEKAIADLQKQAELAPTVAYLDHGTIFPVSGSLKLTVQVLAPPAGPNGWAALRVFFGKTLSSVPVVITSTGQYRDSTAGNIFDVRQDHFDIYLRILPNGAAEPLNIPLYIAVFSPKQ